MCLGEVIDYKGSSKLKKLFSFTFMCMCMGVLSARVSVHHIHGVHLDPEEGIISPLDSIYRQM